MGALSTVSDNNITVDKFALKGNYPNPFNPTTKIRFTNDRNSNVKVTVYALNGEKVATIMNKQVNAGAYDVSWNGKSSNGTIVPTGMYLYDIESDGRRLQGKMLFLK
jgi:flagellar hook assembly protein FlgD